MRSAAALLLLALSGPAAIGPGDERAGYTAWDCGDSAPYGWVRADVVLSYGQAQAIGVAVHEVSHADDGRKLGSCEAFSDSMRSNRYRLWSESRAYCREAAYLIGSGAMPDTAALRYTSARLAHPAYHRFFRLTTEQASAAIVSACREILREQRAPTATGSP